MKKINIQIIVLLLILLLGSSIAITAIAYNNLSYQAQKRLKELGYDPGPLDGIWGEKTQKALKEFQQDNNLSETMSLNKETAKKLGLQVDIFTTDSLIQDLKSEHWYIRSKAVESLGNLQDPKMLQPLITALKDRPGNPF